MPRAKNRPSWPRKLVPGSAVPHSRADPLIESAFLTEASEEKKSWFRDELDRISIAVPRDESGGYPLARFPTPAELIAALEPVEQAIDQLTDAVRNLDMITANRLVARGFDADQAFGQAAGCLSMIHNCDPTELLPEGPFKPHMHEFAFECLGGYLAALKSTVKEELAVLEEAKRANNRRPRLDGHLGRAAGQLGDLFDRFAEFPTIAGQSEAAHALDVQEWRRDFVIQAMDAMGLGKVAASRVDGWLEAWAESAGGVEFAADSQWVEQIAMRVWLRPGLDGFAAPFGPDAAAEHEHPKKLNSAVAFERHSKPSGF